MAKLMGWGERRGLENQHGEPITFVAGERRPAIVGSWPYNTQISLEALLASDPDFVQVRANVVTFDCSNGRADYTIVGWDERRCTLLLVHRYFDRGSAA